MAWFKVDDRLHASPKTRRAGEAMALWVMAGSWCADQLTDGFFPADMAPMLTRNWKKLSEKLVEVGLWVTTSQQGQPGWVFHDWESYQPSRTQVLLAREAAAERQKRARDKAKSRRDAQRDAVDRNAVTDAVSNAVSNPVNNGPPDPTRPLVPTELRQQVKTSSSSASPPTDDDIDFDRFWSHYPRKTHKVNARKAWDAATKKKISAETMIEGAKRYEAERQDQDQRFTAHAATWINGRRWEDSPLIAESAVRAAPDHVPFWDA